MFPSSFFFFPLLFLPFLPSVFRRSTEWMFYLSFFVLKTELMVAVPPDAVFQMNPSSFLSLIVLDDKIVYRFFLDRRRPPEEYPFFFSLTEDSPFSFSLKLSGTYSFPA